MSSQGCACWMASSSCCHASTRGERAGARLLCAVSAMPSKKLCTTCSAVDSAPSVDTKASDWNASVRPLVTLEKSGLAPPNTRSSMPFTVADRPLSSSARNADASITWMSPGSDFHSVSSAVENSSLRNAASSGASVPMSLGSSSIAVVTISETRGTMLDAAASMDSTSAAVVSLTSQSSAPSDVTQFSQAAFIIVTLPSMVVAASRDVVPAICCFC